MYFRMIPGHGPAHQLRRTCAVTGRSRLMLASRTARVDANTRAKMSKPSARTGATHCYGRRLRLQHATPAGKCCHRRSSAYFNNATLLTSRLLHLKFSASGSTVLVLVYPVGSRPLLSVFRTKAVYDQMDRSLAAASLYVHSSCLFCISAHVYYSPVPLILSRLLSTNCSRFARWASLSLSTLLAASCSATFSSTL